MTLLLTFLLAQPAGAQLFADANAAYLSGDMGRAMVFAAIAMGGIACLVFLDPSVERAGFPGVEAEARQAGFGYRRQLRRKRGTLRAGDGQTAHRSCMNMLRRRGDGGQQHLQTAGDQIIERKPNTAVGDVHELYLGL